MKSWTNAIRSEVFELPLLSSIVKVIGKATFL